MFLQQNQNLDFVVVQNGGGEQFSNVSFRLDTQTPVLGVAIYREELSIFTMSFATAETGTHILEVFLNGTQV